MYTLGLCSVSFRKKSPQEIMNAARAAGLSVIEWGSDVHAKKEDLQTLARIASAQAAMGLSCSSYGTYFKLGETPLSELEAYIGAAAILGTNVLRVWCGSKNSQDFTESEKKALFEECRAAAKTAERYGAVLCMECHGGTYTNECTSALELMQAVNSPSFRMYWQPSQNKTVEENLEYAEKIRDYTVNAHVFNWSGKEKYPLADGVSTWKKYLAALGGDKTLLLEFMPDGRLESLSAEAEALKMIAEA
ncbi:MAG: TIM barrel protein [Clostridia bacterium]|nr:TIM barrel protein [Clostridia bacterium]